MAVLVLALLPHILEILVKAFFVTLLLIIGAIVVLFFSEERLTTSHRRRPIWRRIPHAFSVQRSAKKRSGIVAKKK